MSEVQLISSTNGLLSFKKAQSLTSGQKAIGRDNLGLGTMAVAAATDYYTSLEVDGLLVGINNDILGIQANYLRLDGTSLMTGDLDMDGHSVNSILNIYATTIYQNGYQVATLTDLSGYLPLTGGTIDGDLTVVGNLNADTMFQGGSAVLDVTSIGSTVLGYNADLAAIGAIAGTSGILRKTAANTWTLDTATYLTSNQSISLSGDATGSGTTAITVTLANSGVTASTYKSVTVDAKGRVTGGTNPTTLAGYGITDAATSTHTHGNISNSGAIGSTSGLPVITTTSGVLTTGTLTGTGTVLVAATSPTFTTQISTPIVTGSDLYLRSTSSALFGQVNSGSQTCFRGGPAMFSVNQTLGLSSGGNPSAPDVYLNATSAGNASLGTSTSNSSANLTLNNIIVGGYTRFGGITKTSLLALTPNASTQGVWRITDAAQPQSLAYPDGTNWRYVHDNSIVT